MTKNTERGRSRRKSGTLTISDVARMANVGVATVSRVLNNSPKVSPRTAARVKRVLERTNYRPAYAARALASGRTNTIEMLYNTTAEKLSHDPVLLSILDAVHTEIKRAGYRLAFSAIKTEFETVPRNFLQALEHRMADGALIVSVRMTDAALKRLQDLPVVLLDHHGKGMISSVTNNNYRSMCDAVKMAAERGHRRVAFIWSGGHDHNDDERFQGYIDEMERQGIPRRPEFEMVYDDLPEALCRALSIQPCPTLLLTTWTTVLPQIFQILLEKGMRVPRDMSLLTVDSAPGLAPNLTGLVQPVSCHYFQWDSIVKTAMDEVFAVVRGDRPVRHIELPLPFRDEGTLMPPGRSS